MKKIIIYIFFIFAPFLCNSFANSSPFEEKFGKIITVDTNFSFKTLKKVKMGRKDLEVLSARNTYGVTEKVESSLIYFLDIKLKKMGLKLKF